MANFSGWGLIVVAMQNDFLAKGEYYERRERYEKQIREGRLEVDEMVDWLGRPGHSRPGGFEPRSKSLETVIRNIGKVIARARQEQLPIAYLRAVYDHRFKVKARYLWRTPL